MSGYLMDTSVVSAFAPGKPPLTPKADAWFKANRSDLFLPSLAVQELRKGIAMLDRAGGRARAQSLLAWLHGHVSTIQGRILDVDVRVAEEAGIMEDAAIAAGSHPGLADILIAATAKTHSLTLLTANMKHFQPLGIPCLNPFDIP